MSADFDFEGFDGFDWPTTTPTPDVIFDRLLPLLTGAELKVLLYIVRRTFGFRKDSDHISLNQLLTGIRKRDGTQLDYGTGLSKKTLLVALESLKHKRLISSEAVTSPERGHEPTLYRLLLRDEEKSTLPLGEKLHQGGGGKSTPSPRRKNSPIQETVNNPQLNKNGYISMKDRRSETYDEQEHQRRIIESAQRAGFQIPGEE